VLPLHDHWRDPTGAYLVMPLMRCGSLADSLRSGGWNLEPALRLLDQVGNAHLSDFVVATHGHGRLEPIPSRLPVPEEVSGEESTIRSDIFALGALTFEVLCGVPPTDTDPAPDLRDARRDVPEAVAAVVGKAMATDPLDRFAEVDRFLRELRRSAGVDVMGASEVVQTVSEQTRNPYKGLRAFAEDDAVDFHGRTPPHRRAAAPDLHAPPRHRRRPLGEREVLGRPGRPDPGAESRLPARLARLAHDRHVPGLVPLRGARGCAVARGRADSGQPAGRAGPAERFAARQQADPAR
jgi:serine/threonine protein kinase